MPRFIADAMLGRLARWLRLLGFDTIYEPHITDAMLIKTALAEDRLILTKDTSLSKKNIKYLLISSDDVFEQLKEVIIALGLREQSAPRCANCNGQVINIQKQDAEGLVPDYVYLNYNNFMRCVDCGRLYWEGTQYMDVKKRLSEVFRSKNA
jgi:uncharacterized protein with PIN domain